MALTKVSAAMFSTAAQTSDLNLDDGTLFVDSSENRVAIGNTAPAEALDITGNLTLRSRGYLKLQDDAGGQFVALRAPATVSSSVTYTLPAADGSSGQTLSTNGSGTLSWASATAAGTGVTLSGTTISIGQAVATSSDVQFNSVKTTLIEYTDGDDAITIADGGHITAAGNVTVTGNLTVNGATVTNSATNTTIEDLLIELGTGTSGTPASDAGLVLERGSSDNIFIGWDESADVFTVGTGSFTGASTGNLTHTAANAVFGSITGTSITGTGLTIDTATLVVDASNNRVGIGNASPDVSLDIGSYTDAVHLPVGTTGQRPGSPAAGYFRYNSSTNQFEGYTDAWGTVGGGSTTLSTDLFTGNGSTVDFTISQAVDNENKLMVFIDGVYQNPDAYSMPANTTLRFSAAPANSRKIAVYSIVGVVSGTNINIDSFTGDGSDTTFTLSITPVNENNTLVYVAGVYQPKSAYSVSGTTLTFSSAPANSAAIEVATFNQTEINIPVDGTITTAKIADDAVTSDKLASGLTLGGTTTFGSELLIPERLTHAGDTDTHLKFAGANDIRIVAGGVDHIAFDGTIVINQSAADMDVRVESTGNQNMLYIDSGNDVIGVGLNNPHDYYSKNLVVMADGDGTGGITIAAPATDDTVYLAFADGTSGAAQYAGYVGYVHSTDDIILGAGGGTRLTLDSSSAGFSGTITAAGGAANNNDDANILTLSASQHARLLVDTSSTSGHRASLVVESNSNETVLWNTGSAAGLDTTGDFTIDAVGAVTLDSDTGKINFKDGGTTVMEIEKTSNDVRFYSAVQDKDIKFLGNDGNVAITALTLDISDAGSATFNNKVNLGAAGVALLNVTAADGVMDEQYAARFQNNEATAGRNYGVFVAGGSNSSDESFSVRPSTNTSTVYFKVRGDGNVGIGTSSPGAPLNVTSAYSAGAITTALKLATVGGYNSNAGTALDFGSDQTTYSTWITGRIAAPRTGNNWGGSLVFSTNDNSAATAAVERLRISHEGRVGIGTSAPDTPLHVEGPSGSQFVIEATSGNFAQVDFKIGGTQKGAIWVNEATDLMGYYAPSGWGKNFYTGGVERVRIDSNGNLLVGATSGSKHILSKSAASGGMLEIINSSTTNPSNTAFKFTGAAPNDGTRTFFTTADTSAYRGGWLSNGGIQNYQANDSNLSDRREKTNFAPAKAYLETICAIPVQTFNYIDQNMDDDDSPSLGVVAQDVQVVAPELVEESNWGTKDEPKMRLSLYQTDFQFALMKSIQEQQTIIGDLKEKIETLEGKVKALEDS